tara:strand:+ start:430 stop:936 length:507 start_codon:yes stop_codon:yes gene_type:complete
MISTEHNSGSVNVIPSVTVTYGKDADKAKIPKSGQPGLIDPASKNTKLLSYNVGFGSTAPTAAWLKYSVAQCVAAGISTAGMAEGDRKVVEVNVPKSNVKTVQLYGNMGESLKDWNQLYEVTADRKARHKALRDAGFSPPFPRADKFQQNAHQTKKQIGISTAGSYTS